MVRRLKNEHLHRDNQLGRFAIQIGGLDYVATLPINMIPSDDGGLSPTILNVSTSGTGWTAIATGLTNVFAWRLVEKRGNDFHYAYSAAPSTFVTGFGWVSDNTPITDIYVKRPENEDVDMQLEYWSL